MGHLHTFQVLSSTAEEQVERCTECGEKKRYRQINGRSDNNQYLKDHIRDFAQPGGATNAVFQKYYGNSKTK